MTRRRRSSRSLIGKNLVTLRLDASKASGRFISQVEIARRLGIEQSQYSKWETGSVQPDAAAIAALALAFDVSADLLLRGLAWRADHDQIRMAENERPRRRGRRPRAPAREPVAASG